MAERKSIIPLIEACYDNFTQSEKSIADFFINNKQDGDFSIKSVSERLFLSEASLSRFAKKCGLSGYRELVYQYRYSLEESKHIVTRSTKTVMETYWEILNMTYNRRDERQIERIVRCFDKYKRVVVAGIGNSGLVASEMESRFMRVGVDIDSLTETDRIRMQTIFLDESSLVFGLSVSGKTEAVLFLLREAHKRNAKTVLITTRDRKEYHDFCDEIVLSAYTNQLEAGNIVSPQLPLLLMTDVIYNEYLCQNQNEKSAFHDDTLRVLHDNDDSEML